MGKNYSREYLEQLKLGKGGVLVGDTALIILKALLESGVSYLGGYPGAPTSSLHDAIADAYEEILRPMGVYFEGSGNEAAAAAMLEASVHTRMRGAVNWKVVGNNVAADPLAHVAATGVQGGAMVFVGEDYGVNSTSVAERSLPYAHKSSLICIDPRGDAQTMARLVKEGFRLSEYSNMPVLYLLRTRTGNMKGRLVCDDNVEPPISMKRRLEYVEVQPHRVTLPPFMPLQERWKFEQRVPAACRYIVQNHLNELFPGTDPEASVGIITHGMIYNTLMRVLYLLGEADLTGRCRFPVLCLNVVHPLAPEEILGFLRGKERVLVVEEGMPNLLEQQIRAMAQKEGLPVEIFAKDFVPLAGELTPESLMPAVARFLAQEIYRGNGRSAEVMARMEAMQSHLKQASTYLGEPVKPRPPIFCTGCPERPIFSALKIMEQEVGRTYYPGDIGCYSMGGLPPFGYQDSITGMGTGLASASAIGRALSKRPITFMGDGTFWHSGLTTSLANAVYNNQDAVLVIFENFWTSMTGQQENPATGRNMRGEPIARMDIEGTLRGMGVGWIRKVNPYSVKHSLKVLQEAYTTTEPGLKVVISEAECQLEKQRRLRPVLKQQIEAGKPVSEGKFGVDEDVCVGDHACIRYNGCPSLTVKKSPDPLRDDEIVTIAQTCVGCGLCGEIAHAAILCPSFYEVKVVHNPGLLSRLSYSVNRLLLSALFGVRI